MVFVIQCAGRKRDHAGTFRDRNGSPVMFVANPKRMPHDAEGMSMRIPTIYLSPG